MRVLWKKSNKRIDFTVMILTMISLVVWVGMGPIQDTGDDAFIAWELSRGVGSIAAFISPYLSLMLSSLYAYLPYIAWWSWLAVGSGVVLLGVGYSLILKKYKGGFQWALIMIWFAMIWFAVVEKVNFTRTAAAFALAGGMILISVTNDDSLGNVKRAVGTIGGVLLLLFGSMMRFQAALLVFPFMFIYVFFQQGVANFSDMKKCFSKTWILKFGKSLAIVGIAFFCICIMFFLEMYYWNTHPEWKAYNEYNSTRSAIVDYGEYYPTWEKAEVEYKEIGLETEHDLNLLFGVAFVGDTEVYSLETLQGIEAMKSQSVSPLRKVYKMSIKVLDMVTQGKVLFWCIFLLILLRYYIGKKVLLPELVHMACAASVLFFFSYLGRMMLRVWEPTLLCAAGMLVLHFEQGAVSSKRIELKLPEIGKGERTCFEASLKDGVLVFVCICFLLSVTGMTDRLMDLNLPSYSVDRDEKMRGWAEYIDSTKERIYLLSTPLIHHPPYPGFYGIWEPLPGEDYLTNYFALSNWDARTPTNLRKLKGLGIENPAEALMNRTDTFSNYDRYILEFLQDHYSERVTCSKVDSFEDNSSIVQYAVPIEDIDETLNNQSISLFKSDYSMQNECGAWYIEGEINNDRAYEALYCNLVSDDGIYTYRLKLSKKGLFSGGLFEVNESFMRKVEHSYIVGMTKNQEYVNLGELELYKQSQTRTRDKG